MNEPVFGSNLEGIVKVKLFGLVAISFVLAGCEEASAKSRLEVLARKALDKAQNCEDKKAAKELTRLLITIADLGAEKEKQGTLTEQEVEIAAQLEFEALDSEGTVKQCQRKLYEEE